MQYLYRIQGVSLPFAIVILAANILKLVGLQKHQTGGLKCYDSYTPSQGCM